MSRNLARFLPLCFLIAACGTSARQQALIERRDAIRTANAEHQEEFIRTYRGGEGFQDTVWGMSPEEVKALYPEARMTSTEGDLRATTPVADRDATVDFFFAMDKLAAVVVQFEEPDPLREEFDSLSELLRMKYGQPLAERDTTADAERKLWDIESLNDRTERTARMREIGSGRRSTKDPVDAESRQWEEEQRLEAIHARNDFALRSEWQNTETQLALTGRQTPATSMLLLQYESRHLKPYLKRTVESSEAERKREEARDL
ncbi:hypothetical protein [Pyxidicoccus sp. MSG2]|uniref:hypothetical protein n=1 Tax=Pyxidicoccus sp. MSG2 TaxID=2996790 RepID=UPI002271E3F7|nr:hypothetical protein [Pyxidicoccus sp. MSG2]MCY1018712.1 hypothetical protein [Pyxidicoccus sp. MSG2]